MLFDGSFESGNLGRVAAVSEFEFDLSIRPDTNNPHYRVWFNFTVSNVTCGQRVLFNLVNCSKTKSLFRLGMTPLVRSTSRGKWERVPKSQCFYYRSPRHKQAYLFTFAFLFDKAEHYQFAYCYPYTYTYLQRFLHHVDQQQFAFWDRQLLTRTVQHRRVDIITITSPSPLNDKKLPKKIVFLTARVHPGETPASHLCHGALAFLISDHPLARILRSNLVFKIVPMLNPDGVFLGNYRCSSLGFDLNRHWLNPEWSQPSIKATRDLLFTLQGLDFFIDMHAHSTATNSFMFANNASQHSERATTTESEMLFPRLLGMNDRTFSVSSTKFCKDPSKLGTGRRALGEFLSVAPYCYTLEVSLFCYTDRCNKPAPYTEETYSDLGRHLILTFVDFYKLHLIPNPTGDALMARKRREKEKEDRAKPKPADDPAPALRSP
eukprot:NODE_1668_length_1418_cov_28.577847_g1583_i0.p1 GENE.NODE_1668_length_1418_cov_28.577847_g1583_i0~~NODE_1668_length_1418_cov_28.577847_g1583_i0.p1  ORF type:complete len:435 (+),score=119.84 NODE_1668_length_1418_cov_28.577847_g1583_i0:11-1315(+)